MEKPRHAIARKIFHRLRIQLNKIWLVFLIK